MRLKSLPASSIEHSITPVRFECGVRERQREREREREGERETERDGGRGRGRGREGEREREAQQREHSQLFGECLSLSALHAEIN